MLKVNTAGEHYIKRALLPRKKMTSPSSVNKLILQCQVNVPKWKIKNDNNMNNLYGLDVLHIRNLIACF